MMGFISETQTVVDVGQRPTTPFQGELQQPAQPALRISPALGKFIFVVSAVSPRYLSVFLKYPQEELRTFRADILNMVFFQ